MKRYALRGVLAVVLVTMVGCAPKRVERPRGPQQPPMVRIPAGEYIIGTDDGPENERPAHKVRVRAFMIDKFEVTNRAYLQFVRETGFPAPPRWLPDSTILGSTDRLPFDEREADLPVAYVSWQDADAYARWRGCRLPTEAEWEIAARCSTALLYPWGNDSLAADGKHAANAGGESDGFPGLAPAGSFGNGTSCWGAEDLVGNVWEWTADWYMPAAYREASPTGFAEVVSDSLFRQRVIRGGSWFDPPGRVKATTRAGFDPSFRSDIIGFRCARDSE